ncbi:MAG: tRNA (N6-isopentenyl adenosine(37)-C2)-methylthiotransferase MiaB [Melioribacteraceae bacterium]|jgi:tRNA-2-methylthio-N6-dimethylallyladenosine synthase|nr:tRNA (N6-isopentenyl adenosine(37)-C2)-methylthiotransferase MiaB [Melioribacteraceae bacterium]
MNKSKVYIETYGCQMNLADTEVVMGILNNKGYELTKEIDSADVVFLNTCSVRDNAEQRIHGRLGKIGTLKKGNPNLVIGVLGCMAERLRDDLITKKKMVDLVVGPDEYRKLPELINNAVAGEKGIGVKLSRTETYEDIEPYREEGLNAWLSVMRGCDKFCTYCVVPFTRGRERSSKLESVVEDVRKLSERGFREVTLLGQNVNSYSDSENDFADLLVACANIAPNLRIRFMTSHPQDLSDKLLYVISEHSNICNYIHLPVQAGSDRVLKEMNRTYTIEHYFGIIERARKIIPGVTFSTDIIAGFPTETEEEHKMTLDVMAKVRYDGAFMFKYSPRKGTRAFKMEDDIPEEVKSRRLTEIIDQQLQIALEINQELIGTEDIVLVENLSKKSDQFYSGRTDTKKIVILPIANNVKIGDMVKVKIYKATSATLFGAFIEIVDVYKKQNTDNTDLL